MMTLRRVPVRMLAGAAAAVTLLGALLLPASSSAAVAAACGLTTLDATVEPKDDGTLACGPGEAITVREDLAKASPTRAATRRPLLSFVAMTDFGIVDEESPLRTEFRDKCVAGGDADAFRPQETMIPALVDAHVRAVSALATSAAGSPTIHKSYDFAIGLGNATDDKQMNELRAYLDLLDGGRLVNPDSGKEGYEGVQGTDPTGGAPPLTSPVEGMSLRDLGNEPFYAPGLRVGVAPLPWYSTLGNRDVKVWGSTPDDTPGWETFANAWATGSLKINDLGAQYAAEVCRDPAVLSDPSFWTAVAADLGTTRLVTPDPQRALVTRAGWIAEHDDSTGVPTGHGFAQHRCADATGSPLDRGCYAWDQGQFHFVVLDTTPAEGLSDGNIDAAQMAWLERDLKSVSGRYFTASGREKRTEAANRIVVVFQHHPSSSLDNTAPTTSSDARYTAADLEALLLRFPNVVLQMTGHSARNRVRAHADDAHGTGYWEVETSSIADWPSQSRSIEFADNGDGTLSITSVMVDADAPPNARAMDWRRDDPTNERTFGGDRQINEAWLASAAREIAYNDPQASADAIGTRKDRNVELIVRAPAGLPAVIPGVLQPPSVPSITPPSFPFPAPPGGLPTGFPGGLPPDFPTPDLGSLTPQFQPPQSFLTGPGLAVHPQAGGGWTGRAAPMLLLAAAGAIWLLRARVRRWMVGI